MGQCCKPQAEWETPKGKRFKSLVDAEQMLINKELSLGFAALDCNLVFMTLKSFASGDQISMKQFKLAVQELNLPWANSLDSSNTAINAFFANFIDELDLHLNKILILAVFLSAGTPSQKSNLFMRICDPNLQGAITRDRFSDVLKTLEQISTEALKSFAIFSVIDQLVKDKVNSYIHSLCKTKDKAIEKLVTDFFKDQQDIESDVFNWTFTSRCVMMNPYTYRIYMEEVYKTTPVQANFGNIFSAFGNFMASSGTSDSANEGDVQLIEKNNKD